MNLHVSHDARVLAELVGAAPLACAEVVMPFGTPRDVTACILTENPLSEGWSFDPQLPGARLVSWSGSLASDLFAPAPRNWTPAARAAFEAFCDQVRPALERHGWTLCVRPHCRHVLSDVRSCLEHLARREGQPFGLALAPADLLEASMLPHAEEHLERIFSGLGPRADMILLEDVALPEAAAEAERAGAPDLALPLRTVPLGEGMLPREGLLRLLSAHVRPETPVVISARSLDAQCRWLDFDPCATC